MRGRAFALLAMLGVSGALLATPAHANDTKVRIWTPTPVVPERLDAAYDAPAVRPVKVNVKVVFNYPDLRVRAYKRALGQLYPGYIGPFGGQLYPF